jgi:uncharacterized membrane protein required for colicin V production
MTVFDYFVLGIIGFSILVGLMRGAIHELFFRAWMGLGLLLGQPV